MVQVVGKDPSMMHQVTCRNCASILQFTQSEVKVVVETDYTGGKERVYTITCPDCEDKISVTKIVSRL